MCKDCGCAAGKNVRIKLYAKGYDNSDIKNIEKSLLGLPGVYHVHIHSHDGQTTIDYDPAKTRLAEITDVMAASGVHAII